MLSGPPTSCNGLDGAMQGDHILSIWRFGAGSFTLPWHTKALRSRGRRNRRIDHRAFPRIGRPAAGPREATRTDGSHRQRGRLECRVLVGGADRRDVDPLDRAAEGEAQVAEVDRKGSAAGRRTFLKGERRAGDDAPAAGALLRTREGAVAGDGFVAGRENGTTSASSNRSLVRTSARAASKSGGAPASAEPAGLAPECHFAGWPGQSVQDWPGCFSNTMPAPSADEHWERSSESGNHMMILPVAARPDQS